MYLYDGPSYRYISQRWYVAIFADENIFCFLQLMRKFGWFLLVDGCIPGIEGAGNGAIIR
jgi:hypothetical protein